MTDQAPASGHPGGTCDPSCLPCALTQYTSAARGLMVRLDHYTDRGEPTSTCCTTS